MADHHRPDSDRASRTSPLPAAGVTGLVVASALVTELRLPLLGLLVIVVAVGRSGSPVRWVAAGALPVVVLQAWAMLPAPPAGPATADCANLLSPPAVWRAFEAAMVVALVLVLLRVLGSSTRELGLVRPTLNRLAVSVASGFVVAAGSLVVGPLLAAPFFGPIQLDLGDPMAMAPALILAIGNAVQEEVAYRGAMLAWLSRASGPRVALLAQAVAFGAAHGGSDFTASPLPVMAVVAAGGLVAGLIVQRTGSLVFVIAVHAGFDIPLHPAIACRVR